MAQEVTLQQVCEALPVAAANMIANPSKIVAGGLAEDSVGNTVSTLDPTACKFCALGALAKELKVDVLWTHDLRELLEDAGFSKEASGAIYIANDHGFVDNDPLRGARKMQDIHAALCSVQG